MMIPIQKNSVPYTAIGRLTRILFNIALRIGQKTTKDTFESLPRKPIARLTETVPILMLLKTRCDHQQQQKRVQHTLVQVLRVMLPATQTQNTLTILTEI
jgi:hypothetical protein